MAFPAVLPDTPGIRRLRFAAIAPGRPYHAALSMTEGAGARGFRVTEHTHDFYEMLFVLAGNALHGINGTVTRLGSGDLILLRPGDRHYIQFETGRLLHYINIAIDADLWRTFHGLVGMDTPVPILRYASDGFAGRNVVGECETVFRRALVRFQDTQLPVSTLRTEACLLLATVAPYLLGDEWQKNYSDANLLGTVPPWLSDACKKLRHDPNALRCGLAAFVAESGVTRTHLARVLKAATGQTPTEYVNNLRLERAAVLLTTTTLSILDIAEECGFEQPTYFLPPFPHPLSNRAARLSDRRRAPCRAQIAAASPIAMRKGAFTKKRLFP